MPVTPTPTLTPTVMPGTATGDQDDCGNSHESLSPDGDRTLTATATPTAVKTATPTVMPSTATYYVDAVNGSDANAGTSRNQAWKTIQKAANTMVAGNTVTVLPGTYYSDLVQDAQVQVTKSGANGAPITYQAEGVVKMKGFVISADYIAIKGFDIVTLKDRAVGIQVDKGGYCLIENNYIHYSTMGGITLKGTPARACTNP